jgi:hypothetical protein
VISCFRVGDSLQILARVNQKGYANRLIDSATVLCLPGLGFDTYRVFESLMAGYVCVWMWMRVSVRQYVRVFV